jgi:hypothetical protein
MKNLFTLFLLLTSISFKAQKINLKIQDTSIIACPNNMIYVEPPTGWYAVPGNPITVYDPTFPISSGNPSQIGISMPNGWGGLALGPNINSSTVGTTFYTQVYNSSTSKGDIKYWNGSSWVFTGHSFPTPQFINLGMGGNYLYGLTTITASMGVVYKYDGTSNPVYLTTVNGWNDGGPFDLSVDCNGNWSILKADGPQWLRTYDPSGNLLIQYSITGLPISSQGGGLAIINNKVYAHSSNSLAIGTISGSTINFTTIPWATPLVSDFAVCPDCSISTGVSEETNSLISVFPNPSTGKITLKYKNTTGVIEVLNVLGEKLMELHSEKSRITDLDLQNYSNGIYFIQFSDGNIKTREKLILNK